MSCIEQSSNHGLDRSRVTFESWADDAVVADSRRAGHIFLFAALLLLVGAALGLNTWPGEAFVVALRDRGLPHAFETLVSVAATANLLFVFARPSRALLRTVAIAWAIVSLLSLGVPALRPSQLPDGSWLYFLNGTLALPASIALVWRVGSDKPDQQLFARRLRWLAGLTVLFILMPQSALSLTATLHPLTLDTHALHWDRLAGLDRTPELIGLLNAVPGLAALVQFAYDMAPLAFLGVPLLQLKGKRPVVPTALLVWVAMTCFALVAYHFFPICGPRYLFGAEHFIAELGAAAPPLGWTPVKSYPRNGMPSMHFGWMLAACIIWWQSGTRIWSRALMVIMTGLTAAATLYTGEHYAVDLIVAVPFVLACLGLCSVGVSWSDPARTKVVATGFSCWLVWVWVLRTQMDLLTRYPSLCWLMVLATAGAVCLQVIWVRGFAATAAAPIAPRGASKFHVRLGILYFVSGAAALVYQVLFAKKLALVFGSTSTATLTVLATFLGGMAIGSLIGGHWAQRSRRPLISYVLVELGIALFCMATPYLFDGVQITYVALAEGMAPDAPALLLLRVVLGATVLLVPTVLMGITLPLLAQVLARSGDRLGVQVAWLYMTNTAGAALGALLTAYWVIPALGVTGTTSAAAALNLAVALVALKLAARSEVLASSNQLVGAEKGLPEKSSCGVAMLCLGVGGLLALGLEVVYVHMLSIVAGNSVFAFGLMVATFLLGLSLGGECARRLLKLRGFDTAIGLLYSFAGLSVAVTIGLLAWNQIPAYFASFETYPLVRSFESREAVRGLICALVMLPPTVFIGAAYVLGMDRVTVGAAGIRGLGYAAALNTTGNIGGVMLFGFLLLPHWGGVGASRGIAITAALLALLIAVRLCRHKGPKVWLPLGAAFAIQIVGITFSLDLARLSSGANVYFAHQDWGHVIDHAESIDGGLTSVTERRQPNGQTFRTLLTNGKFQGTDAPKGEMQAQIGFALAPLLHQPARERALVIGYGSGVTTRVLHESGFQSVDVAELSKDVMTMTDRYFGLANAMVSTQPGVSVSITDGRNFLQLSNHSYDLVSIEVTSIWFAGAASLYNREFYQLAKMRLKPEGVLQQWVQLHHMAPEDLLAVIATLRSEFPYVSMYVIGGQGILVASVSKELATFSPEALVQLNSRAELNSVRKLFGAPIESVLNDLLLDSAAIDRLLRSMGSSFDIWISTDNNSLLEYGTPKGNVLDGQRSYSENINFLRRYRRVAGGVDAGGK